MVMLGLGVIGPNLTDIRKSFGVSYGEISWGVSVFALARLVTNIPAGIAASRLPRLPVLIAGTVMVVAGSIIAALSTGLPMFLVARAFSGVGSSVATTVGLTIALDSAAPEHRGKASGYFHSAIGGGAFFGPGVGGLLAILGGWRAALFGAAGAAALSLVALALVARQPARPRVAPAGEAQPVGSQSMAGLLLGAASAAYVATFAIFFARGAVQQTITPLMGRDVIGLSAFTLSALLMGSAAFSSIVGPYAGGLSDRFGRSAVMLPGLALLAVGVAVLSTATNAPLFIAGLVVTALAGTMNSVPSSMIIDAAGPTRRGFAIGLYRVVGDLALTLAPLLSGWIIDIDGFRTSGLVSAGLVLAAFALAVARSRARRPALPPAYFEEPGEEAAAAT